VADVRLADDEERQDVMGEMSSQQVADGNEQDEEDAMLLPELVAHLRANRGTLREEWASRIKEAHLLSAMTPQEVFS
jgi:rsbT co-antagonist protein RsbR